MPDSFIIEHCSPTLAGIKTANLFSYVFPEDANPIEELRELNRILLPKGLRAIPICFDQARVLIYVYRVQALERDLDRTEVRKVLESMGYSCDDCAKSIAQLAARLKKGNGFPHEIGFFLGYPPEDVIGFMNHPHDGYKCSGIWKVYGDEKEARRLFNLYQHCTAVYKDQIRKGSTLSRLTVASRS